MTQIWIPKYDETLNWLRKNGYHGQGGVYSDKENAKQFGRELKAKGYTVKLRTHKGKWGTTYTIWAKK